MRKIYFLKFMVISALLFSRFSMAAQPPTFAGPGRYQIVGQAKMVASHAVLVVFADTDEATTLAIAWPSNPHARHSLMLQFDSLLGQSVRAVVVISAPIRQYRGVAKLQELTAIAPDPLGRVAGSGFWPIK